MEIKEVESEQWSWVTPTFKNILLTIGLPLETIGEWTEEQCKAEWDDIKREQADVHKH